MNRPVFICYNAFLKVFQNRGERYVEEAKTLRKKPFSTIDGTHRKNNYRNYVVKMLETCYKAINKTRDRFLVQPGLSIIPEKKQLSIKMHSYEFQIF